MDIDGVLSAFNAPVYRTANGHAPYHPYHRIAVVNGYSLILDTRHPEWIAEMSALADMKFASMWQADAVTAFAPVVGFGHTWPFIPFDDLADELHFTRRRIGNGVVHYKWAGILAEDVSGRAIVYVDDDMAPEHHRWAHKRHNSGSPTLFIQPDPAEGLTEAHYERIMDFLHLHSELGVAV